jgi:hypothetical protein
MHAGITDEWDSSICLFHAMYGGRQLPVEFRNVRPTTAFKTPYGDKAACQVVCTLMDWCWCRAVTNSSLGQSALVPDDDPGDWRLYQAALALFRQRQRQYGLPVHVNHSNLNTMQI